MQLCSILPLPARGLDLKYFLHILFFVGLYTLYLIKLEDIRDFILDDLYGIIPCSIPPIDTLTDVAFEYSIIANTLLVNPIAYLSTDYHPHLLLAGCWLCRMHSLAADTLACHVCSKHLPSDHPCPRHVHQSCSPNS